MADKKLYYWPESEKDVHSTEFIVPVLNQLVEVKGTSKKIKEFMATEFEISCYLANYIEQK